LATRFTLPLDMNRSGYGTPITDVGRRRTEGGDSFPRFPLSDFRQNGASSIRPLSSDFRQRTSLPPSSVLRFPSGPCSWHFIPAFYTIPLGTQHGAVLLEPDDVVVVVTQLLQNLVRVRADARGLLPALSRHVIETEPGWKKAFGGQAITCMRLEAYGPARLIAMAIRQLTDGIDAHGLDALCL